MNSISPKWKGLPIVLTNHATDKAFELYLDVWDIKQLLEYSEDCSDGKREKDVYERCTTWKGHNIKIVFKKSYSGWFECLSWIIIITIIGER